MDEIKYHIIAGGAGFIGMNLVKRLLKDDNNFIFILDNLSSGVVENIQSLDNPMVVAWVCDIVDKPILNAIMERNIMPYVKGNECRIWNLACPASPPFYQADPIHTTRTCVDGSINLLEIAREYGCRYLYTSTSEVYGDPLEHPQKESYRGNVNCSGIRSCYDEGKRCGESLCFDYHRKQGVDVRVVRIFNTYGPYMRPDDGRCVSNFINQALDGKDITVYGDGSQTRSLCYVDDLVEGLLLMMDSDEIGPVNLGNPNEMTILDIAKHINKVVNGEDDKSKIVFKELPSDDPLVRKPDISKAKKVLGWEPKVSFADGINRTIQYFKQLRY